MQNFHERLAKLADQVRALPEGEEVARSLIRLAGDVDTYIEEQWRLRNEHDGDLMQKWNEFMNERVSDTQRYYEDRQPIERRKFARHIAASPLWQGGYADVLRLLTEENKDA